MARQGSATAKKKEAKGLKKYYKSKKDESVGAKKAQTPAVRRKESVATKKADKKRVKVTVKAGGRGAPGKAKSAAHKAAIGAGLRAYWKAVHSGKRKRVNYNHKTHKRLVRNSSRNSTKSVKRGPGRPRKVKEEAVKRGPGRPRKVKEAVKRGPGRPRKVKEEVKRGPGRPRKVKEDEVKRGPGRPPKAKAKGPGRPRLPGRG